jgi:translation elongation factor EF-1beta
MKRVVIQYKVKPEQAEHNVELLNDFYDELERTQPEGLGHAVLRLADGVTFIHIAEETEAAEGRLWRIESFQRFEDGISERCDVPPAVQGSSEVGSFRLFASSSPATETHP